MVPSPPKVRAEADSFVTTGGLIASAVGIGLLFVSKPDHVVAPYLAAVAALLVIAVPRLRELSSGFFERLRHPSRQWRVITACALLGTSGRYFMLSASLAGREFHPGVHDEFMNLLQARMLAHGRLWMPTHELADFFDSFSILVRPVYGSMYFPGAALFYVPGDWFGVAPWTSSVIICAACVSVAYLVFSHLFDGVGGLLAALLLIALPQLRTMAISAMSHPAMLLLTLLAVWAYLRWRVAHSLGWAALVGLASGWAAITRPLDAACLLGPLLMSFAWEALRRPAWNKRLLPLAVAAAAGSPFPALQLIFDYAVTGHWLQTPVALYDRNNFPGLSLGFHARTLPAQGSPSPLPQVRVHYEQFFRKPLTEHGQHGFLRTWAVERLGPAADVALPAHMLLALLPFALFSVCRWGDPVRLALAAGVITVPLAYTLFPIYLGHYGLVCVPAFVFLVLQAGLLNRRVALGFSVFVVTLTLASLPELRRSPDPFLHTPYLDDIELKLASLEHVPAVVLFNYSGKTDVLEEPVYNIDVAWPDDARIIRAQDRGGDNQRIFAYYAARKPDRYFYRYDRRTCELTDLGWAADLAARTAGPTTAGTAKQ